MARPMSPATRASRASLTSRSARGSATRGTVTGVGSNADGSGTGGAGGTGGRETTDRSSSTAGAGSRTITGLGTSFSTIRTSRDCSKRVASAIPAINNCTKPIRPRLQHASGNTGSLPAPASRGFSETMP